MPEIQKVSYTHDGMIDLIVSNPAISQGQIAAHFGYSQTWVSIVFNSDSFKERLEERKAEIIDPALRASIEEKLRALADLSFQVVMDRLAAGRDAALGLKSLDLATRALGYGASPRAVQQTVVNVQPVAIVPAKELNSEAWKAAFDPRRPALEVVDVEPLRSTGE